MRKTLTLLTFFSLTTQAATFSLDAGTSQPFYQSTLPAEVYQYSRHNDLSDLHVFNAANELVPHAFISLPSKSTVKIEPLKFVKINEAALKNATNLRLNIESNSSASNIIIEGNRVVSARDQKLFFLVALKDKHTPIQQLTFNWKGSYNKLIGIEVASSNDLQTWRVLNTGNLFQTMQTSKLNDELHNSILKNNLELSDIGDKYLKITISGDNTLSDETDYFALEQLSAETNTDVTIKPVQLNSTLTFLNRTEDHKAAQTNMEFEATGRYPAEALSIKLPQANTVVSFSILTRNNSNDAWQHLTSGNAYQFNQNNQTLNSPDITFSPTTARYWRLQFNAAGGGIGAENPQLALKFLPQIIVWNARGNAPFALKVGEDEVNVKPSNFALSNLMPEANAGKIKALPSANLKLADADGNTPMWQVSTLESSHKPLYLWAGLGLGVLLLFGMAFSLLRRPN